MVWCTVAHTQTSTYLTVDNLVVSNFASNVTFLLLKVACKSNMADDKCSISISTCSNILSALSFFLFFCFNDDVDVG